MTVIVPLAHPIVLLPHNRAQLSLETSDVIIALVPQNDVAKLFQYGVIACRLALPLPTISPLIQHSVTVYSDDHDSPLPLPVVDAFRAAAAQFIDSLIRISRVSSSRDSLIRFADRLVHLPDHRTPRIADLLLASIELDYQDKLAYLSAHDPVPRLQLATTLLAKFSSISTSAKFNSPVEDSLSLQQKELFLRHLLAVVQRELQAVRSPQRQHGVNSPPLSVSPGAAKNDIDIDDDDTDADDLADIKRRLEAMHPGSEERKTGVREWKHLKRIPQGGVESGVVRSYLEWLTALPWPNMATPNQSPTTTLSTKVFLANARAQLDADHFGLDKVKRRLIEFLAVVRLKEANAAAEAAKSDQKQQQPANKGPILLFVGPPGTGKTSLGKSVAKALGRPFQRISFGGVRDEAEIRGHRRTYVASGPGLIVQALRKAGRLDPVILLDEIDKVGHNNFHGDPAAALLEVLDPEQNHAFHDHYISVPVDLSQVLFICTANTLETMSAPLLDRCEVVRLSGYTHDEKTHIARRFLIPKQLHANALTSEHVAIADEALARVVGEYTREAGVRSLERVVGAVVRYKAVEWAERREAGDNTQGAEDDGAAEDGYVPVVEAPDLERILGVARFDREERERGEEPRRGVVYGLVVSGDVGEGGVVAVESLIVPGGSGRLKLTGSLGEVIKESGELALSWVKRHAYELCVTDRRGQDPLRMPPDDLAVDVHLHLPAGAQRKDGPSAGIAMTCALVSLLTGACVPTHVAMTGEITLRGRITAVGGIKEKVLGAHRAHVRTVVLPWANRTDVEQDVPHEVKRAMRFAYVRTVEEALDAAFGRGVLTWRIDGPSTAAAVLVESRL